MRGNGGRLTLKWKRHFERLVGFNPLPVRPLLSEDSSEFKILILISKVGGMFTCQIRMFPSSYLYSVDVAFIPPYPDQTIHNSTQERNANGFFTTGTTIFSCNIGLLTMLHAKYL